VSKNTARLFRTKRQDHTQFCQGNTAGLGDGRASWIIAAGLRKGTNGRDTKEPNMKEVHKHHAVQSDRRPAQDGTKTLGSMPRAGSRASKILNPCASAAPAACQAGDHRIPAPTVQLTNVERQMGSVLETSLLGSGSAHVERILTFTQSRPHVSRVLLPQTQHRGKRESRLTLEKPRG